MHHIDLSTLQLAKGNHNRRDDGVCLMEAVAYFADEPHSDRPQCASPALTSFGIGLNDQWDEEWRQKLVPFIPRLIGTRDDRDEVRGYMALDWLVRTFTPAWLDLAGLTEAAASLRDHRRIVDLVAAQSIGPLVRDAASQSAAAGDAAGAAAWAAAWAAAGDAAGDAAWAAAWAAAGDAAWTAAGDAAWAAAWAAAGAAAWAAARDAAWAAAGAAAGDALAPTVETLKLSALELFDAMIDPQVPAEVPA